MDKPKLIIINGNQFGYSAGHYYYCKYLRGSFEIQYICFDRNRKKLALDGVHVHYISFSGNQVKRLIRFLYLSSKICNKLKPDILLVVYFSLCHLLTITCKSKTKILDIRTGSLSLHPVKRKFENTKIQLKSLFFDKVIILSESLKKKIHILNRKVMVLPLGADVFYKGNHSYQKINMLYVGTLHKRNIHETLEGLGILLLRNPGLISEITYTLISFGSEQEKNSLAKVVEKYNLTANVSFEGLKNYNELSPYFEKCNVGVAYTPITDYFNCQPVTKIYEYALSGLYTIATKTDENMRSITDDNGILCDDSPDSFANALEEVYKKLGTLNELKIRRSLEKNHWGILVNDKLKPFLNE